MGNENDIDCKIVCVRGKVREMCHKNGRLVTNRGMDGRCEKQGVISESDIIHD